MYPLFSTVTLYNFSSRPPVACGLKRNIRAEILQNKHSYIKQSTFSHSPRAAVSLLFKFCCILNSGPLLELVRAPQSQRRKSCPGTRGRTQRAPPPSQSHPTGVVSDRPSDVRARPFLQRDGRPRRRVSARRSPAARPPSSKREVCARAVRLCGCGKECVGWRSVRHAKRFRE